MAAAIRRCRPRSSLHSRGRFPAATSYVRIRTSRQSHHGLSFRSIETRDEPDEGHAAELEPDPSERNLRLAVAAGNASFLIGNAEPVASGTSFRRPPAPGRRLSRKIAEPVHATRAPARRSRQCTRSARDRERPSPCPESRRRGEAHTSLKVNGETLRVDSSTSKGRKAGGAARCGQAGRSQSRQLIPIGVTSSAPRSSRFP